MPFVFRTMAGRLWIIQLAEQVHRHVDRLTKGWPPFEKTHFGDQLTRAVSSIGANLSEGYARTHSKERQQFFSIAQGSLEESLFWVRRVRDRGLIRPLDASAISSLLIKLSKAITHFMAEQQK